jgi:hypothetical protein
MQLVKSVAEYDSLLQRLDGHARVAHAIAEVKRSVEWGFEKSVTSFDLAMRRDDQLRYAVDRSSEIMRMQHLTPDDERELRGIASMALASRFALSAELLAHAKRGDARFAPAHMEATPRELEDVKAAMGDALGMDPSRVFVDVATTLARIEQKHAAGDTAVLEYLDELNWLGSRCLVDAANHADQSGFAKSNGPAARPIVAKTASDGEVKSSPLARFQLTKLSL